MGWFVWIIYVYFLNLLIDCSFVVEIDMDKNWLNIRDRCDRRYITGINNFLDWAFNQPNTSTVIRCP